MRESEINEKNAKMTEKNSWANEKISEELKAAATSGSSKSLLKLLSSQFFNDQAHNIALYS